MVQAPIKRLSNEAGNQIRAPAIICSFHNVVEELVLNSLDAGADYIEVAIDMQSFSVECRDNGVGIDLCSENGKLFGKWQCTSKKIELSDTSFGFRGEAIAAISALSAEFGVASKCKASTFVKRGSHPVYFSEGINHWQSGTIVKAGNVYGSLQVRQKAMRIPKEIARVKEFFQKMCLLHHRVSLSLFDFQVTQGPHRIIRSKTLFRQSEQESVSSMFRSFHGQQPASQMISVDLELYGFRISGLLSPPLSLQPPSMFSAGSCGTWFAGSVSTFLSSSSNLVAFRGSRCDKYRPVTICSGISLSPSPSAMPGSSLPLRCR